jgi:uncharacterized protein
MKSIEPTETVIAKTKEWLEKAVIGLNLCPFAKAVYIKNQIRFTVSEATTDEDLLSDLVTEIKYLSETDAKKTDTALLILPNVLEDFLDYNEFLEIADRALVEMGFEGIFQIASFHPKYQFAGTEQDDISNFTNRSPYPILQLLREDSISKAVDSYTDIKSVPDKNIETMNKLGINGWKKLNIPSGS